MTSRRTHKWAALWLLSVILFSACKSNQHLAPIDQLDQPPSIRLQHHVVSRGDTLYGIAWRYSMDFHELANLNGLRPPYRIFVGQKLALAAESRSSSAVVSSGVSEGVHAVPDSGGVREVSGAGGVREIPAVSAEPAVQKPTSPQSVAVTPTAAKAVDWVWPARGQLISRFIAGNPRQKGIDIAGATGDAVVASSSGSVVYAGNGLAGYGQLIIIKHNEQFLSAYAHNSRLLVAEGETVRQGQQIAEMGATETDRTKLHFEIRQAGKPVDPVPFLPAK